MLPTFPYTSMVITGVIHSVLGSVIFLCTISGIIMKQQGNHFIVPSEHVHLNSIFGSLVPISMWIMMVGVLGVLTGRKNSEHRRTHHMKIAYMVTAILSAVIFSSAVMVFSVIIRVVTEFYGLGVIMNLCGFAVFVLSIVSSSICCCCAESNPNPARVVFVSVPPGSVNPLQSQPGTHFPNFPISSRGAV